MEMYIGGKCVIIEFEKLQYVSQEKSLMMSKRPPLTFLKKLTSILNFKMCVSTLDKKNLLVLGGIQAELGTFQNLI